jgi:hypothetical protein
MKKYQIDLEVRKAIRIGKFWQDMLNESARRGISPEHCFQSSLQGSDLEGLILISPLDLKDLESYVNWLETQETPPPWGRQYAKQAAKLTKSIRATPASQKEQDLALDLLWKKFKQKYNISFL